MRKPREATGRNGVMHEVSLMTEAVRLAVKAACDAGAKRITLVRLRVGELSGAVPDAMRFAWDVVSRNSMASGAQLEIETVLPVARCRNCGAEFDCSDWFNECPLCRTVTGELRRGRELEIASVEFE